MTPDRPLGDPEMAPLHPSTRSLPPDALYEILLRLPAKDLCRLRAVCQTWRSLLSDPRFAAAHSARHPGPLIITGYDRSQYYTKRPNKGIICDLVDLSGRVVKRVAVAQDGPGRVMSIQGGLVCTRSWGWMGKSYELLNPVTGAVCALPEGFAKEHARKRDISEYNAFLSLGKVASTGDCKVLRMLDNSSDTRPKQLCEVFTLGGKDSRWRRKKAPEDIVYLDFWKSVVIDGVVYFLSYLPDFIALFDLETEVWSQALQGPPINLLDDDCIHKLYWLTFSMATVNGCLVVVHRTHASSIDLWFLMDMENGLWVKQHTIPPIPSSVKGSVISPLLVLDDGRIVLIDIGKGLIRTYNLRSNTFTDMAVGYCVAVGLYTGSLLSLPTSTS